MNSSPILLIFEILATFLLTFHGTRQDLNIFTLSSVTIRIKSVRANSTRNDRFDLDIHNRPYKD